MLKPWRQNQDSTSECHSSPAHTMRTYDCGIKKWKFPLSIKHKDLTQFPPLTHSTKQLTSPSPPSLPCLTSPWHLMMKRQMFYAPQNWLRRALPQLKTTYATSPFIHYCHGSLCYHHSTLGVKCLHVHLPLKAEIPLCCGMNSRHCNLLDLRPQRPEEAFPVNLRQNAINHP